MTRTICITTIILSIDCCCSAIAFLTGVVVIRASAGGELNEEKGEEKRKENVGVGHHS